MTHTLKSVRPVRFLTAGLVILLLTAGCGGKTQPTKPAADQPTRIPAQSTLTTAPPTRPPAQSTPVPSLTPAPTSRPGKFADPKDLNSYRMKTTLWPKGEDKTKASVIITEWIKNPPAEHTVMGATEVITIGDTTWAKIMGRWIQQDQSPTTQAQAADLMRQIEDKIVYKEVGRETVNGIACKKYTYSGEATVALTEGPMKGTVSMRGQGEAWVADQPPLPPVLVRNRGETETKLLGTPRPGLKTGDLNLAMSMEMELYDINQPITIQPPTDVFTPPTPPAGAAGRATPTRSAGQPVSPGPTALTPAPELKLCFDNFPLYPDAKTDAAVALMGRSVAASMGSPSESRGYQTTAPYADVQAFYQAQPAKVGWQGSPIVVQEGVQWWTKDKFVVALIIFRPTDNRKETQISVSCVVNKDAAPTSSPTRPVAAATVAPRPTAVTSAAPLNTPAGSSATWNFDGPNDQKWYAEGGMDAKVGVEYRPGYLRFTASSGNDLFPGSNFDAPTLFRVVGGDFTMEARLEFVPTEDYQGAGLYIWQDQDNFVRLERCFGGLGGIESGICFLKVEGGEPEMIAGAPQIPTTAERVDLRLQRAGNRVTAWWRDASTGSAGAWQTVGSTEIALPGGPQPLMERALRAGMLLCVEHGASEINADFDVFRLWGQ